MKHLALVLLTIAGMHSLRAQAPGRLELVRCSAASDVACVRLRVAGSVANPVVIVESADLGRSAFVGSIALRDDAVPAHRATIAWRPPLMALPAYQGVADSASLSPALRESLLLGTGVGSNRPIVALLMAALVGGIWLLAQRLGRPDLADAPRAARERATTITTDPAGVTPEGPPRKPEDITHQTARRTAMGR